MTNTIVGPRITPKAFLKKMTDQKENSPKPPTKLKLLTFEDYKQDIRARWLIFQKEWNELIIDIKKAIDFLSPIIKENIDKAINWIKNFRKK